MAHAIVIGGGIIGLSSAYYLNQSGWEVTVIDKTDMQNNCSFGNMGYVCPSHFIPLATPGIVKQGFKWLLDPMSPFYIQPRFSRSLFDWGLKFIKSATAAHVENSAAPLCNIALLSKKLYEEWNAIPGFDFAYQQKGMAEYFQTAANAEHAKHTVEKAHQLGLTDTVLLNKEQVQQMESHTELNVAGAIYFKCDAHLWPNKLMQQLQQFLNAKGVLFQPNEEVRQFEKTNNKVTCVITNKNTYDADITVLAAGSWSRETAAMLNLKLPLVAGRGYSLTLENSPYQLNYPAILTEGRVAITPIAKNVIRFGGTMEITSPNTPPNIRRMKGILRSVKQFLPAFDIPMPAANDVWHGYRPCSADGLPYIGKTRHLKNCIIATGHAMLGLSLGPATGKLISELANEKSTSMNIRPFDVHRFD